MCTIGLAFTLSKPVSLKYEQTVRAAAFKRAYIFYVKRYSKCLGLSKFILCLASPNWLVLKHIHVPKKCTCTLHALKYITRILYLLCFTICAKDWDFYMFIFVTEWRKYSIIIINFISVLNNSVCFSVVCRFFPDKR